MKRHSSLFVCIIVLIIALAAAHANAALLPQRVQAAAQAYVDAGQYPALVIAYVDGERSEVDAYGKLGDGRAPDADTVFEIGSLTKTFTATLLAQDVAAGRLKLDTPVASLLGGWTLPSRNGKPITLLDLADQHSGLPRLPGNLAPADAANPYADYDAAKLKAFLAGYALPRDPGASYEYSNLGFGLLGFALAQHAHASYPAFLESRLLRPLGMRMSATTPSDAMRAHLAPGHGEDGKPAKKWNFDALAGCGALYSNANDLLRYLRANMAAAASGKDSAMKLAQQPQRALGQAGHIGLAWMTRTTKSGDVVWHNGMTGGYASAMALSADGKRGIVVLTNIAASVDDLAFAALDAEAPLPPARKTIALDAAMLDDYVGDYRLAEHFLVNISRKDDQLFAQATGQGAFPIFASARDEFFAKVAGISISFRRDAGGKVASLVLHQNGDHAAPKLAGEAKDAATQPGDATSLGDYAGEYQLAPGARFSVTVKDAQLYAQLTGQAAYPVYATARDRFRYRVVDAQLDFERDGDGRVVALVLHQNGRDQRAPRVTP